MSTVKRVSGNYDVYANVITLHGNVVINGGVTSFDATNTVIKDNIIVLNYGETGAGVTAGSAGILVDRGSSSNAAIRWNEATATWQVSADSITYSNIASSFVSGNVSPGGSAGSVQFKNGTNFAGDSILTYDSNSKVLSIGNISIGADSITNIVSDIIVNSPFRMTNQSVTPTAASSHTTLYANTPGGGGTGVYFVNTTNSDELVSKTKATVLSLIFS